MNNDYIFYVCVGFIAYVIIARWVFGIYKIVDNLKKQTEYLAEMSETLKRIEKNTSRNTNQK